MGGAAEVVDAALDLLLGGSCVACRRPGRALCRSCEAGLPRTARLSWPTPTPPGLAPPWAAGEYADAVRSLVLALKEHGVLALRAPLGRMLAAAVATAGSVASRAGDDRGAVVLVLVPVPSRPTTVRARGHDPTLDVTRRAAGVLRASGVRAIAVPLLRTRPGMLDQSGLDARARAANLAGSLQCPSPGVRRLARTCPRARVVVCDDVLTTGATAREAQRALEAVGLTVTAIATVAATRRRQQQADAGHHPGSGRLALPTPPTTV